MPLKNKVCRWKTRFAAETQRSPLKHKVCRWSSLFWRSLPLNNVRRWKQKLPAATKRILHLFHGSGMYKCQITPSGWVKVSITLNIQYYQYVCIECTKHLQNVSKEYSNIYMYPNILLNVISYFNVLECATLQHRSSNIKTLVNIIWSMVLLCHRGVLPLNMNSRFNIFQHIETCSWQQVLSLQASFPQPLPILPFSYWRCQHWSTWHQLIISNG